MPDPAPFPINDSVHQRQQTRHTSAPPVQPRRAAPRPPQTPVPPVRSRPVPPRSPQTPLPPVRPASPQPRQTYAPPRPRQTYAPARPQQTPTPPAQRYRPARRRREPWEHRIAALSGGAALYGATDYYSKAQFAQNAAALNHIWISVQFGAYTPQLTTGSLLLGLLLSIPMFFGAAFGPWVGLLIGAIGGLTGDYLAAPASGLSFDWRWGAAMGLLGFLSSIAQFRTRQRYGLLATTCIAFFAGVFALALAIGGWAWSLYWNMSGVYAMNILTAFAPSALIAILLLSLLLFIYNAIISRD